MLVAGFDLETTGNKIEGNRIVELALILYDLDTWVERKRIIQRFNPQIKISPGASAVHGIYDSDVALCSTFASYAVNLAKVMDRIDLFVGHNLIGFDFPVIVNEFNRVGASLTRNPNVCDTMLEGRWATPDGKYPTLGELCWSLSVDYDHNKAHAADYDVDCNLAAFHRGLELGYFSVQH